MDNLLNEVRVLAESWRVRPWYDYPQYDILMGEQRRLEERLKVALNAPVSLYYLEQDKELTVSIKF